MPLSRNALAPSVRDVIYECNAPYNKKVYKNFLKTYLPYSEDLNNRLLLAQYSEEITIRIPESKA